MARARLDGAHEVVNLASDSDDEWDPGAEFEVPDAREETAGSAEDVDMREFGAGYNPFYDDPDGVIDLTGIPDIDVPPSDTGPAYPEAQEHRNFNEDDDARLVTEAYGLQMILDFLPDISIDHVLDLLRRKTTDFTRTAAKCQNIITQLVEEGTYPKEAEEANKKKRKRDDEDEGKEYDKAERDPEVPNYESDA
jgi:TRIAD3 protein (E3 ubiquitin-protein ligase RNF216)